jgi:hypothetical protein
LGELGGGGKLIEKLRRGKGACKTYKASTSSTEQVSTLLLAGKVPVKRSM